MRTRFRRRRAAWAHAGSGTLDLNASSLDLDGFSITWVWLLPPARAQFLMNTRLNNRLTYGGSHLWLDFFWRNSSGSGMNLFDVDFGVIKSSWTDSNATQPDLSMVLSQWGEPETPNAISTWDSADDDDGTESYLWQHHIKGSSPPNAQIHTVAPTGNSSINQVFDLGGGSVDDPSYMCRKFHVTQEWQPDVVIRSKRRLQKGEGILLYMTAAAGAVTTDNIAICNTRFRTLVR